MADYEATDRDTSSQHHRRGSSQQRIQQQYQHLIQSPYKIPVLPQLHSSEETAPGSRDRAFRSPVSSYLPHTPSSLKSPGAQPSTAEPIPLKQWPYVQSTHPSHPWDPQALHNSIDTSSPHPATHHTAAGFDPRIRQQSQSPAVLHDPRHGSTSTSDSSGAGREDEVKEKKKPSSLTAKVKAKMKDLFARDEYDQPVKAARRRRSNPWEDEDY